MDNIDIYNNSSIILSRKVPKKIISWISVLISITLFIIIFGTFVKFMKYEKTIGIVNKNTLTVLLTKDKLNEIKNKLIIKNKEYEFSINSISKDYIISDNKNYYEVILDLELDDEYKINNNILDISIELGKKTLLKETLNFFKKGMV